MSDTLVVLLEDAVAGALTRSPGGRLSFAYHEEYRRRPEATPLSLSLPKQVGEHSGARLEAWLWGLLPDDDAVLRRWARQFHVRVASTRTKADPTQPRSRACSVTRCAPPPQRTPSAASPTRSRGTG